MNRSNAVAHTRSPAKGRILATRLSMGSVVDGKFEIARHIGEGSASDVYAATHLLLGHEVALKCLKLDGRSPQTMIRVRREARAALVLRYNAHVATVHDVGLLSNGAPYLVMELLGGCDLAAHLRANGVLPIAQAVDIAVQVCAALAAAHPRGLVHRDVKPSNVFLSGDLSHVRLLDFGVCKFMRVENASLEESVTADTAMVGCPYYMAPEQLRCARRVDPRCDLWSVGVLVHRMLTGHYPFAGDNALSFCASILSADPIALRAVRSDVPPALERVVLRALERNVDRRIESAAALLRALAPFGSERSRQIEARAESEVERIFPRPDNKSPI